MIRRAFCWACYRVYLRFELPWRIARRLLPYAGEYAYADEVKRFASRPLGVLIISIAAGLILYFKLSWITGCVDYRSCQ